MLKNQTITPTKIKGFSLVELLIVVTIFAILSVVGTQIVTVSLRSTTKSEEMSTVREDVDFVLNVINRQLRNAKSIDCTASNPIQLSYTNADGNPATIACVNSTNGEIRLDGTRINSANTLINCNFPTVPAIFICTPSIGTNPPAVQVALTARNSANSTSVVSSVVNIVLRSY
ncbi:prepilin-type N-terminal cleavage/methylation domain-containing protein [Candidatus Woesebacteria bacterium]|nr:MAG: prepilin-type N-terminal cleavage/methylation domain-containing protein [Candidatus Woesebacteria bacterium]